jgi:hypothetical protein
MSSALWARNNIYDAKAASVRVSLLGWGRSSPFGPGVSRNDASPLWTTAAAEVGEKNFAS